MTEIPQAISDPIPHRKEFRERLKVYRHRTSHGFLYSRHVKAVLLWLLLADVAHLGHSIFPLDLILFHLTMQIESPKGIAVVGIETLTPDFGWSRRAVHSPIRFAIRSVAGTIRMEMLRLADSTEY